MLQAKGCRVKAIYDNKTVDILTRGAVTLGEINKNKDSNLRTVRNTTRSQISV